MQLEPQELRFAEKVAARIGGRWATVETDDLTSHLYLWLVENLATVKRYRVEDGGAGKLYVALRREAAKYCAREHAARVGRPIREGNFYSAALVARVLPYVFEDAPQTTVRVNPVTGQAEQLPAEFDVALAILADVRGGLYGLNSDLRTTLEYRYRDGLTFEEIGELRGVTKDGAKKQVDRALGRLVDALAGDPI